MTTIEGLGEPLEEPPGEEGDDQQAKEGADDTPVVAIPDLTSADELEEDDHEDDDGPDS